jgi:hypothetical protein
VTDHPAYEKMRLAVHALVTSPGSIQERLRDAEPYFSEIDHRELRNDPESHLDGRINAHLTAAADDDDPDDASLMGTWIEALSDEQAIDIAGDLFRLFELVAGLRDPAGEWPTKRL